MLKIVLSGFIGVLAMPALAQTESEPNEPITNSYCQERIGSDDSFMEGFGTIELSGEEMVFESWKTNPPHNTMTFTFPDQTITLTADNVHRGSLGDYILTIIAHRHEGFEPFGAIPIKDDEYQLLLVQPFGTDQSNCIFSAVRIAK